MFNAMMKEVRCALTAESIKISKMIDSLTLTNDAATELRKVEASIDHARSTLFDLEETTRQEDAIETTRRQNGIKWKR